MDVVSQEKRSQMMAGIKGKNTKPEMLVRSYLHNKGFRFRLHKSSLPGKPDIVLTRYKVCIFVHGCFWHRHDGCNLASNPKSRQDFWAKKFADNTLRDQKSQTALRDAGWRTIVIWECGLRKLGADGLAWLPDWLNGKERAAEWP